MPDNKERGSRDGRAGNATTVHQPIRPVERRVKLPEEDHPKGLRNARWRDGEAISREQWQPHTQRHAEPITNVKEAELLRFAGRFEFALRLDRTHAGSVTVE